MTAADASELYLGDLSPCPPWHVSDSDVSVAGADTGAGAVRAGVVGSAPRLITQEDGEAQETLGSLGL